MFSVESGFVNYFEDLLKFHKMNEPQTIETMQASLRQFGVVEFVVFVGVLVGCGFYGIYHALQETNLGANGNEYLLGGRNMNTFPVAISLVASFISGITLLATPTEIYLYGTEYMFVFIPLFLTGIVASYVLLPVFHDMHLSSVYEYLEIRFDKTVRLFNSLMFTVTQICGLPVVVYVPATVFSQVTGVNIHIVTPCVALICVSYTCLGGLKSVVFIEVIQTWFMLGSMVLVSVKASLDVGGFAEVWRRNYEGGRLVVPTFNPDLTIRHTFWALIFGGLTTCIQGGIINQNAIQRYLSLPTLSHARRALWIFVLGTTGLILICCYSGMVIYATYRDCDPLTTELARSKDQVLLLLAMRVLSNVPGLPGLFVAGVFSASLSSLSSGLNSISAVVLEDFVKPFVKKDPSDRATCFITRGAVLIFGALILFLIATPEKLGTLIELFAGLGSMTSGPGFGVFFSGLFLPWVNAKGALFGGLLGLLTSGFVIIGAQNAIAMKTLTFFSKPTSVEGCQYYYNASVLSSATQVISKNSTVFPLFKISYFWYTALGAAFTIIFALLISALTGFSDIKEIEPTCLPPLIRNRIPRTKSEYLKHEEQELINKLKKDKV